MVAAEAEATIPDEGATGGATGRGTGAAIGALVTGGAGLPRDTATAGGGTGVLGVGAGGIWLALAVRSLEPWVAIPTAVSTASESTNATIVVSGGGGSGAGALGSDATCATGSVAVDSRAAERARYCHAPSAITAIAAAIPPSIAIDGAEVEEALVPQNRHPPRDRG